MTQYIKKAAVVAEIEKRAIEAGLHDGVIAETRKDECYSILSFINTLETKEVDLEKETTHYLLYEHRSPLNEIMHKADIKAEMQYHKDIENAFKAGFELGMTVSNKTQKGE